MLKMEDSDMKKVVCILLCCIVFTCTACGNNGGAFEQATAELADSTEQNVEEADEISGSEELQESDSKNDENEKSSDDLQEPSDDLQESLDAEQENEASENAGSNRHEGIITHENDESSYDYGTLSNAMAYRIFSAHYDQLISTTDEKKHNAIAQDMYTAMQYAGAVNVAYGIDPDSRPLDDYYVLLLYIYFGEDGNSILGAYKTFAEADEEAYRRVEEMTALGDYELLLDKAYSCESVVDTLQFAYDNYGQY